MSAPIDSIIDTSAIASTGIRLTRMALGGSAIGNLGRAVSEAEARAVLALAWQSGIRYFDTAPHHGRGRSEQRLDRFVAGVPRAQLKLSTKVGRVLRPGPALTEADGFVDPLPNAVHYDYSASGTEESLAGSRRRLQTDYFDVVYVHDIGNLTHAAMGDRHLGDLLDGGLPYLARAQGQGSDWRLWDRRQRNRVCISHSGATPTRCYFARRTLDIAGSLGGGRPRAA